MEETSLLPSREALLTVAGIAILSFLLGTVVVEFELFPYPQLLKKPYRMLQGGETSRPFYEGRFSPTQWQPARTPKTGVQTHLPDKAVQGFTFVTSVLRPGARLLDMEGDVVHEWEVPYEKAFPDREPLPKNSFHWRAARLLPNGDVIAICTAVGLTRWGMGVVKVDRNSSVIWSYDGRAHHDLDIGEDGRIYTLIHEISDRKNTPLKNRADLPPRLLEDSVVILSPDGKEEKRISILKALANSPEFSHLLRPLARPERLFRYTNHPLALKFNWDPTHLNAIDRIPESFAGHHDFAEEGQLLLSLRDLDTLAILDPETERIVWVQRGPWFAQHDPDPLPDGNILLFDNLGAAKGTGLARILAFHPETGSVTWSYTGSTEAPFACAIRGSQQHLPGGNVLITEAEAGRLFEVTAEGEIVWEWINPKRETLSDGRELIELLTGGTRHPAGDLTFLDE